MTSPGYSGVRNPESKSETGVSVFSNSNFGFRISTRPPLDSGTVDEVHERKTLFHSDFRIPNPLSKPLDTGTVDEFHKPNIRQGLQQNIHCPNCASSNRWTATEETSDGHRLASRENMKVT